jgi:hypothetical protein
MGMPDVPLPDMETLRPLRRHDRFSIDEGTVERILSGSMGRDDVPPAYRCITDALDRLRTASMCPDPLDEPSAVAAMVASMAGAPDDSARLGRWAGRGSRRIAAVSAAVVGSVSLFTGLAAANALPGAVQSVASHVLSHLGVDVNDPNAHSAGHPDVRGNSAGHPDTPPTSTPPAGKGNGSDISQLAHATPATGVDKGAEISTEASGGQSQAGQHGASATAPHPAPKATPPVSTPHSGGPGNPPAAATGGGGAAGSANAAAHSDGHSAAGSSNAATRKP